MKKLRKAVFVYFYNPTNNSSREQVCRPTWYIRKITKIMFQLQYQACGTACSRTFPSRPDERADPSASRVPLQLHVVPAHAHVGTQMSARAPIAVHTMILVYVTQLERALVHDVRIGRSIRSNMCKTVVPSVVRHVAHVL